MYGVTMYALQSCVSCKGDPDWDRPAGQHWRQDDCPEELGGLRGRLR